MGALIGLAVGSVFVFIYQILDYYSAPHIVFWAFGIFCGAFPFIFMV